MKMDPFKSTKLFTAPPSIIQHIIKNIENYFWSQQFEVKTIPLQSGAYDISVTKGNQFKAVLGMKSALKIVVRPQGNSIFVEAGVGIFGQQAIPTLITVFIAWPVIIGQIWGMVEQAKLDDKVMEIVEETISLHNREESISKSVKYCSACGAKASFDAKFCGSCGMPF